VPPFGGNSVTEEDEEVPAFPPFTVFDTEVEVVKIYPPLPPPPILHSRHL
jgi:hypothetical protein